MSSIYKYTKFEYAESIIKNCALHFTNPLEFNDPFDCSKRLIDFYLDFDYSKRGEETNILVSVLYDMFPLAFGDKEEYLKKIEKDPSLLEEMLKDIQIKKIERSSVCSFCTKDNHILLWAHYANNHKGIALEFDLNIIPQFPNVPENTIEQRIIDYGSQLGKFNYLQDFSQGYYKIFFSKSKDWEYESEYRIVILNKRGFVEFNKSFLKRIIFGYRVSDNQREDFMQLCKTKNYLNMKFSYVDVEGINLVIKHI